MAKKGKKAVPVQMKKGDSNVITIPLERHKLRTPIPPCQRFHSRDRDVASGRSRKPKHKGHQSW